MTQAFLSLGLLLAILDKDASSWVLDRGYICRLVLAVHLVSGSGLGVQGSRTTSASTAPCTSRRTCCPTHCAGDCAPCQQFSDGFNLHLLQPGVNSTGYMPGSSEQRRLVLAEHLVSGLGTDFSMWIQGLWFDFKNLNPGFAGLRMWIQGLWCGGLGLGFRGWGLGF